MALSFSPCAPPIPCPKLTRIYAIQRPLKLKPSIIESPNFEISISSTTKAPSDRAILCSNLSSGVELQQELPPSAVILVKGLARSTGEGGLKAAFSLYGEVDRVKLVLDKESKQSLGVAYIWFTREEHAQAAIEEMNGQFFEGRFIHVTLVKPGSCKTRREPSSYNF